MNETTRVTRQDGGARDAAMLEVAPVETGRGIRAE